MGYYINQNLNGTQLPPKHKADYLLLDGGVEIKEPKIFVQGLICVIENPTFDAAGFIYSEEELRAFSDPEDIRPKRWIIHPKAAELAGYKY